MNNTTKTVLGLSALGVIGIISIAPTVPTMLRRIVDPHKSVGHSMQTLALLALLQTTILAIFCAWLGARLGPSLGLRSLVFGGGGDGFTAWPIAAAVLLGVLSGTVVGRFAPALVSHFRTTPLSARLLYGGLTEEVLVRWGLLSVALWLFARLYPADVAADARARAVVAILVVTVVFASAHLPVLRAATLRSPAQCATIIFFVSLPWGWLAWAYGIETAMLAHLTFHAAVQMLAP